MGDKLLIELNEAGDLKMKFSGDPCAHLAVLTSAITKVMLEVIKAGDIDYRGACDFLDIVCRSTKQDLKIACVKEFKKEVSEL